jgi:transposase-like protein
MLNFKGMRFPIDVILVCIRWYVAYPLSYRHLEEMMEERGVSVDHDGTDAMSFADQFYALAGQVRPV